MQTWRRLRTCAKHRRSPYLDCQRRRASRASPRCRPRHAGERSANRADAGYEQRRDGEEALPGSRLASWEAVAAARAAKGDWHQLHARTQLCSHHADGPQECSGKDAPLADASPCFATNQHLSGTSPESCPLDHSVVAWTERNLGLHRSRPVSMPAKQPARNCSGWQRD